MLDRRRIVQQWKQDEARVLVTLVRTEGSSYRRPGAHLLIGADGEYTGTISGGCLEAEVVRKAVWMVRDGAMVERYSTLFDDTAEIPFGLGCGGVVDLLLEPADTAECHAFVAAMRASVDGAQMVVATWLPEPGIRLRRVVFDAAGALVFRSEGLQMGEFEAIGSNAVTSAHPDSQIYVEKLSVPLRLIVLGAGDDAQPLVTMAALLGWRVIVADGRPQLARRDRFPEAERVVLATSAGELGVTAADAVVLMTHSYEQDRAFLIGLLAPHRSPGYLGLLGASHRSSLLVSESASALGCSIAECCERVWAPVGLDLGGDGAEAIALAIVAEVQAWVQGKLGASRRLTAARVEEHLTKDNSSRYLQTQCALDAAK